MATDSIRSRGIPFATRAPDNRDSPFDFPAGATYQGWSTQVDGSLERSGGPLVLRVEVDTSRAGAGYLWFVRAHSWVEPVLVELDRGRALTLRVAKTQAFWSAYARCTSWCRSLSDDGAL